MTEVDKVKQKLEHGIPHHMTEVDKGQAKVRAWHFTSAQLFSLNLNFITSYINYLTWSRRCLLCLSGLLYLLISQCLCPIPSLPTFSWCRKSIFGYVSHWTPQITASSNLADLNLLLEKWIAQLLSSLLCNFTLRFSQGCELLQCWSWSPRNWNT